MHFTRSLLLRFSAVSLLLLCILFAGCKKKKEAVFVADPKFREVISAYTSGLISVQSAIRIHLANDYPATVQPNTPIDMDLFDFSPDIRGSAYWLDNRTIEFRPELKLKGNTVYSCRFFVSKLLNVSPELKTFEFGFQTINQSFAVHIIGFKPYENTSLVWNKITGSVITGDIMEIEEIEKVLSAKQDQKSLHVSWMADPGKKSFTFTVDSVKRIEKENEVLIEWNGNPIHIEDNIGREKVSIPALGDFKLMHTKVVQEPEQYIHLIFSDPLLKSQNLEGLIRMENAVSLTYTIADNEIRVYPVVRQKGSVKLYVEEGIKNSMGYRFKETQTINLAFESLNPSVRLLGKGVILPNSQGLIFPFEAMNLKAVEVKIIRIFENNITQFFQVNRFDGQSELKRVGRLLTSDAF